ncbi:MAG: hypothetical protein JXQ87_10705 [Bacteroidia bacterium]
MNRSEVIKETAALVQKDFYFEDLKDNLPQTVEDGYQQILDALAKRIAHMLDYEFELLMQVFYRIDLNEQKVKQAIASADAPSEKLAHLVIEREMQKAQTRMVYKKRNFDYRM